MKPVQLPAGLHAPLYMLTELMALAEKPTKEFGARSLQPVPGVFPEYLPGGLLGCTCDLGRLGQGGGDTGLIKDLAPRKMSLSWFWIFRNGIALARL